MYSLYHIFAFLYCAVSISAGVLDQRAACSADNCARAITGKNASPLLASRKADCSSFLLYTVTPDVVTSTATAIVTAPVTSTSIVTTTVTSVISTTTTSSIEIDVTSTSTEFDTTTITPTTDTVTVTATSGTYHPERLKIREGEIGRRVTTATPSLVPTYASACSGTARYSSACSCFGLTVRTTTLTAITSTITASNIATTTIGDASTAVVIVSTTTVVVTSTSFTSNFATAVTTTATISAVATDTATVTETDSFTCPTQVVGNGGFESGELSPFIFQGLPNFQGHPTIISIIDDPTIAHSGNFYAQISSPDTTVNFNLSQTVTVCPGAPYTLNIYSSSKHTGMGSEMCFLSVCVNDHCGTYDPRVFNAVEIEHVQNLIVLEYPGTKNGETSATISITVKPDGLVYCGRSEINFDDFTLVLN